MREERLKVLLNELGQRVTEPVRPDLCEQIKQQIPNRLTRHKIGWDTINIIVDLRLSKSVAAAVIIITMILLLNLFWGRDATGGIFQDSILLVKYWGGSGENALSAVRSKYEHLLHRGENVMWYGDWIDPEDTHALLMHQKLSEGKYIVTFADGREREVNSEGLIKLLAWMLQKKTK